MDSGDSLTEVINDDALDNKSLLTFYRNAKRNDLKSPSSPKPSTSTSSKLKSPKKLDLLTYHDFQSLDTNESDCVIERKPVFNAPLYQQPAFQSLSLRQQVQMLCSYHTYIAKNITKRAQTSFECAPLPKPIQAAGKFDPLLKDLKDIDGEAVNNIDPFDALLDSPDTEEYISRSGRVTKRKFYSETTNEIKKQKMVDEEWTEMKALPSTPKSSNRPKNPDTTSKNSQPKILSRTNQEILARSPLFRDNRLAKIAEGVEHKTYTDKMEEQKLETFQNTLIIDDDVIEDVTSDSSDSFRAVVPPPKRGPKNRKVTEPKNAPKAKPRPKNQTQKKPPDIKEEEAKKMFKKMVQCPICNREFWTKEIEEHASTCGDNIMPTRSHNSGPLSVSCPNCDQVFLDDEERARHIKNCS